MKRTVVVLGSGPIRIGQGIEFDYSCVHCVWALQKAGYRAVIVNNNPETVSTDFDTADALYFEPVTLHDVLKVVRHESAIGVVVQFGGQTAINLAAGLAQAGVPVLGTSSESIRLAEDREAFDHVLQRCRVDRPAGKAVQSLDEAAAVASRVGYPVLVRPSFVLGGRAMEIVEDEQRLRQFFGQALAANPGQPVLVDRYVVGTEVEVDVISDGTDTFVPGVMEHVERAGVHSGDSMAVYPPVSLSMSVQAEVVETACKLAVELRVLGMMNIQFVVSGGKPHVIEVNPRASRTVPYLSKVTGIPMVAVATLAMMGKTLESLGYGSGLWFPSGGEAKENAYWSPRVNGQIVPPGQIGSHLHMPRFYAVKAPVFSFQKLAKVDPTLGPEMKSTGEVLGIDTTYEAALYKSLVASGVTFRSGGQVILTVADSDKPTAALIGKKLIDAGFALAATKGTHAALQEAGIKCELVNKIQEGSPNLLDKLFDGGASLMINTPVPAGLSTKEADRIRRACIETGVPCVTSIDTAKALADALALFSQPEKASCKCLTDYVRSPALQVSCS